MSKPAGSRNFIPISSITCLQNQPSMASEMSPSRNVRTGAASIARGGAPKLRQLLSAGDKPRGHGPPSSAKRSKPLSASDGSNNTQADKKTAQPVSSIGLGR